MKSIGFRHVYNRKKQLNEKGQALVQLEIRVGNLKRYYSENTYLEPHQWNGKVINHPRERSLNNLLQTRILELENFELSQERLKKPLTIELFNDFMNKESYDSFIEFFEDYNNKLRGAYSTYKQYRSALNHVKRFGKMNLLSDLTPANLQAFSDYLRSEGLSQQTIYNVHKRLKTVIRRAWIADRIQKNPYESLKIERGRTSIRRYLTNEEIQKIENYHPISESLQKVKDVFLFSCYTGLGYSDLSNFTVTEDQGKWIVDTRKKTGEGFMVYLTTKALDILNRYDRLPVMSNQVTNRYLKELAFRSGVDKEISFHMARHSCAVYLLNSGVPLEVVSKILGHASVKTTQEYAKVLKGTIRKFMEGL